MAAEIIPVVAAVIMTIAAGYGIRKLRRRLREIREDASRRTLPPAHPYRPPQPPEKVRRRAAHLAGHATLALHSDHIAALEDVDMVLGRFRYHARDLDTLAGKWELAVICMAGLAGEYAAHLPVRSLISYVADVRQVRMLAEDGYGCHGRRAVEALLDPYREILDGRRPAIGQEAVPEDLRDFVTAAYIEARGRLRRHEAVFEHIRRTLIAEGYLPATLLRTLH